ncbi:hypothetical protein ABPG72_002597 [Tetrahymena utriculariae]
MELQKQSISYLKDFLNSETSCHINLELLLSDKNLNDGDLQSLSSILEKCNNRLALSLQLRCRVDDQDSQNMYSFLAKYTNLQTIKLYLESNKMDAQESVSILGSGLYKCIRLQSLELYFYYGLNQSQKDKLRAKIFQMKRLVKKQFYL